MLCGEDDLRRAIDECGRAIELDPAYAQARVCRAWARAELAGNFLDYQPEAEAYASARADALRAIDLAPSLADARRAQRRSTLRADSGVDTYRRELNPSDTGCP